MAKIKVLPNKLINQIAAGEVIERPASVLKELVENSIDAGANRVDILIDNGGLTRIEVIDNGSGMDKDDLETAFIRHATSKITREEDLSSLTSLGFRGEALPSIASVSRVTIKSRTKNHSEGHLLVLEGGELIKRQVVGCKIGTSITVENLFYNTPARLKFMGSARAETQRISALFKQLALSHPNISFRYFRDGKEIALTSGSGRLINAITALFDSKTVKHLLALEHCRNDYRVTGFISDPELTQYNRRNQFFFVNNRAIQDANIRHALESAYGRMLAHRSYPLAFLNITIPPADVDVNVHPTKSEVRFARKRDVHALITAAVQQALANSARLVGDEAAAALDYLPGTTETSGLKEPVRQYQVFNHGTVDSPLDRPSSAVNIAGSAEFPAVSYVQKLAADIEYNRSASVDYAREIPLELSQIMLLGQVHSSFIVIQNKRGMAVIDQHAAHERIIIERLRRKTSEQHIQFFAVPLTLSFARLTSDLIKDYLSELNELGIIMEAFGTNNFLVRGIPDFLAGRLSIDELKETISEVFTNENNVSKWHDNLLISLSCKSAVKIHQTLTREEMLMLITDLANTPNWRFCPHGRPIIWEIPFNDLERKFNRV